MEKDLFPSRGEALPTADYAPRMEHSPEGGCGCDGDGHEVGHHHDHGGYTHGLNTEHDGHCHGHGGHGHPRGGSCESQFPAETPCGGCVGFEGCGPDSWGLCEYPLAMVYAPCQMFRGLYDPDTALSRGTLFTELDLPLGSNCGSHTSLACSCRGERSKS
jgi:hypothetical protein